MDNKSIIVEIEATTVKKVELRGKSFDSINILSQIREKKFNIDSFMGLHSQNTEVKEDSDYVARVYLKGENGETLILSTTDE